METKALKKQMGAAIAMVLVAAVALAASTFAWFVTNNSVEATTSTIGAQSNAAYMTIENGTSGASLVDQTTVTTNVGKAKLYPATFGEEANSTKGKFMTGFGKALADGTLNSSLSLVGNEGLISEAANLGYALQQDFNISSKGQNLTNIQVAKVEGDSHFTYDADASLKTALRVLITNDDNDNKVWAVYRFDTDKKAYVEVLGSAETGTENFGNVEAGKDTPVHVYLYYEGSDENVTSANLQNGKLDATQAVTVTFTATAQNK